MNILLKCIVTAGLALVAATALAESCRPSVYLQANDDLTTDFQQQGVNARLEATLARDVQIDADLASLGLDKAEGKQITSRTSGVVRRVFDWGDIANGQASLRLDGVKQASAVVTNNKRTLLMYFVNGEPRSADGVPIMVAPLVGMEIKFVIAQGATIRFEGDKRFLVAGSKVAFGRPAGDAYAFRLVAPARFDETLSPLSPQRLEVTRPLRAAASGKLYLNVTGAGVDYRALRFTVCIDVEGAGVGRNAVVAPEARFIDQSGDVARFEVRVPGNVETLWKSDAARGHLGGWLPVVGLPSVVRVIGYSGDKVVIDAAGPLTLSDARIAIAIGVGMLVLLFLASTIWLRSFNPFAIVSELMRGKSGKYSLSNVQVLMWTGLVIFALAYNWATTGELMAISEGILVLLGIAGGTSVLTRALAVNANPVPASVNAPPSTEPVSKQLFSSDEGDFDLLRFQMLGFTVFTWCYALGELLRNQGLPDIPQSFYWLMGISNSAFIGSKVPGALARQEARKNAAPDEPPSEAEQQIPPADLKKMQEKLGIPQTGVIDAATRAGVVKFKQDKGILPADNTVDALLMRKIESGG